MWDEYVTFCVVITVLFHTLHTHILLACQRLHNISGSGGNRSDISVRVAGLGTQDHCLQQKGEGKRYQKANAALYG